MAVKSGFAMKERLAKWWRRHLGFNAVPGLGRTKAFGVSVVVLMLCSAVAAVLIDRLHPCFGVRWPVLANVVAGTLSIPLTLLVAFLGIEAVRELRQRTDMAVARVDYLVRPIFRQGPLADRVASIDWHQWGQDLLQGVYVSHTGRAVAAFEEMVTEPLVAALSQLRASDAISDQDQNLIDGVLDTLSSSRGDAVVAWGGLFVYEADLQKALTLALVDAPRRTEKKVRNRILAAALIVLVVPLLAYWPVSWVLGWVGDAVCRLPS